MAEYVRRLRELVGGHELLQAPSVSIALRGVHGRVLLARHSEGAVWLLPGGAIEPAEVPADGAVREMFEETALLVRLTRLVGVFGGPEFVIHYRNGDRTSYVMTVFEAEQAGAAAGWNGSDGNPVRDGARSGGASEGRLRSKHRAGRCAPLWPGDLRNAV